MSETWKCANCYHTKWTVESSKQDPTVCVGCYTAYTAGAKAEREKVLGILGEVVDYGVPVPALVLVRAIRRRVEEG